MQSLEGLVCPKCHEPLTTIEAGRELRCVRDGSRYPLVDGIPSFLMTGGDTVTLAGCALSLVIPALNEAANLERILPVLARALSALGPTNEIIVVDGGSTDGTQEVVRKHDARLVSQKLPGFGSAYRAGFEQARGEYILTLDADGSHDPAFLGDLWAARLQGDVVIASRYVPGGAADMPAWRRLLSRVLNITFRRGLSLPVHDLSSGFRLYHRTVLRAVNLAVSDFDILEEILIRALAAGYRVVEVPFRYRQRLRYAIISRLVTGFTRVLDVGCGSSRILSAVPGMLGLDIQLHKLRYARRYGNPLVHGSIFALPFVDSAFDCVICSEVIEHIPAQEKPFDELARVLKTGGRLILGTPDYDRWRWRALEWLYGRLSPGGYADEHITHYGRANLATYLQGKGFAIESIDYVGGSEMIFSLRKLAPMVSPVAVRSVRTALRVERPANAA